jgi:hypothetical protein
MGRDGKKGGSAGGRGNGGRGHRDKRGGRGGGSRGEKLYIENIDELMLREKGRLANSDDEDEDEDEESVEGNEEEDGNDEEQEKKPSAHDKTVFSKLAGALEQSESDVAKAPADKPEAAMNRRER